ncbi:MAG: ABC transporter permease [Bacteroidales bacterium]|nr:ABC transporter permease [Bacteroidales bacterium]
MSVLSFLIKKELKQFIRNPFLPRLAFVFPFVVMLLMPWVATMDINEVKLSIVDQDNSLSSQRLINKIDASDYFNLKTVYKEYEKSLSDLENGDNDIILEIPHNFEKDIINGEKSSLQISANTVDGTKGTLASNYLTGIIYNFASEIMAEKGLAADTGNLIETNFMYNEFLNYKHFMIPALIVVVIIMMCSFLPSINIVSEKEIGTIEQINVTPVSKIAFIFSKLIPYWAMGIIILTICFALTAIVYSLTPAGGFFNVYLISIIFIITMSGFGLVISNYSSTMQQAMFIMYFFMMIFMLMSGIFTPVSSMPDWAQWLSYLSPPRYFAESMRSVYLKGSSIVDLRNSIGLLTLYAVFLNGWAVISYKKRM